MTDRPSARATFDDFARFYDAFTAHHDYDAWMPALEALALRHGLKGRRLLDVATGTGKSFLPLLRRGYEVSACDVSPAMLSRAAAKAGSTVELFEADMRALPGLGRFDFVTCIDEPLNYLLSPGDLSAAFASARECLRRDAIYLFDLNTLGAYRSLFSTDSSYDAEGWFFVWRGCSSPDVEPGACAEATIEAFEPCEDGSWRRMTSRHVQRHFPAALVTDLLEQAGLRELAVYGQSPDGRIDDHVDELRHTKRIHVASRPV